MAHGQEERILKAASSAPISLGELIDLTGGPSGFQDVCKLISKGLLTFDMDEELSNQVLIELNVEVPKWQLIA